MDHHPFIMLQEAGDALSTLRAELKANVLAALPQPQQLLDPVHAVLDVLLDETLVSSARGGYEL